jgi:hypothetical protein
VLLRDTSAELNVFARMRRPTGSVDSGVFESVAGSFQRQHVSVVDYAVDHRCGNDLVAEHVAPAGEGRFEIRITEACS